jgi:hypothetical protein
MTAVGVLGTNGEGDGAGFLPLHATSNVVARRIRRRGLGTVVI